MLWHQFWSLSPTVLQVYQTISVNVLMIVVVIPGELIPGAVGLLRPPYLIQVEVSLRRCIAAGGSGAEPAVPC